MFNVIAEDDRGKNILHHLNWSNIIVIKKKKKKKKFCLSIARKEDLQAKAPVRYDSLKNERMNYVQII